MKARDKGAVATADQSLDAKTADKALSVDLLNILKKAKSGRPLTRYERGIVESAKSKHIAINVKTRKRSVSVKTYIFDSMAACSSAAGVPIGILKAAKRMGCEGFQWNRVDLRSFLAWWFENREGMGVNEQQERSLILREERLALEREREKDEGSTMLVDEAVTLYGAALLPIRQRLLSMPTEVCADANPTDPQLAREVLQRWVDESLPMIRRGLPVNGERKEINGNETGHDARKAEAAVRESQSDRDESGRVEMQDRGDEGRDTAGGGMADAQNGA
jgi:hypothetical protein